MPQMVVHRYTKYTEIGMMDMDNQIVVYKALDSNELAVGILMCKIYTKFL